MCLIYLWLGFIGREPIQTTNSYNRSYVWRKVQGRTRFEPVALRTTHTRNQRSYELSHNLARYNIVRAHNKTPSKPIFGLGLSGDLSACVGQTILASQSQNINNNQRGVNRSSESNSLGNQEKCMAARILEDVKPLLPPPPPHLQQPSGVTVFCIGFVQKTLLFEPIVFLNF